MSQQQRPIHKPRVLLCVAALTVGLMTAPAAAQSKVPAAVRAAVDVTVPRLDPLSVGRNHACAVVPLGTVKCWGSNLKGQLGNNTSVPSAVPVVVKSADGVGVLAGVLQVAAGGNHSCALQESGHVWCWGLNRRGQLGDGTLVDRALPVEVLDAGQSLDATWISAGGEHTCAVLRNGVVDCWGYNSAGQLGSGSSTNSPVPVPVIDGTDAAVTSVKRVTAGDEHTCALRSDGKVLCWGSNYFNQLGNASAVDSDVAVEAASLTNAIDVRTNVSHTCAITADNSLWCWGQNSSGQVGVNPDTSALVNVPTRVHNADDSAFSGVTSVAVGFAHTCALRTTGAVYCLGSNQRGQLGAEAVATTSSVPLLAGQITGAVLLRAGSNQTCALVTSGGVRCWGDRMTGQLGDGHFGFEVSPQTSLATGVTAMSISDRASCAVVAGSKVRCWGANESGQLGDGSMVASAVPVTVKSDASTDLANVTAVGTGASFACGLLTDKTVTCWGANGQGQLGQGFLSARSLSPVAVQGGLAHVTQVTTGTSHACALLENTSVMCWGSNLHGELGIDSTTRSMVPVSVKDEAGTGSLTGVQQVVASAGFTCALLINTEVRCWGVNDDGELGDGTTTIRKVPVAVLDPTGATHLSGATSVAAGDYFACATVALGEGRCWGWNGDGELGAGNDDTISLAVSVKDAAGATMTGISAFAPGQSHNCVLMQADGSVSCWGDGSRGQLGDGTYYSYRLTPSPTGLTGVTALRSGAMSVCALPTDGSLRCWGNDDYGQLALGLFGWTATPVAVLGLTLATTPTTPLAVTVKTGGRGRLVISWARPLMDGGLPVSYFELQFKRAGKKAIVKRATTTTYTASGLTRKKKYSVTVKACNSLGCTAALAKTVRVK